MASFFFFEAVETNSNGSFGHVSTLLDHVNDKKNLKDENQP